LALLRCYDASTPPARPPTWEIAAGYIGGDTPYVWTREDWDRQPARYRLPIFTRSNLGGDPETDVAAAEAKLAELGAPPGRMVAWDGETAQLGAYLTRVQDIITRPVLDYGSLSAVLRNPRTRGGRWSADWTDVAHIDADPYVVGTQWASATMLGAGCDASVFHDSIAAMLWDTHPHPITHPEDDVTDVFSLNSITAVTGQRYLLNWPKGRVTSAAAVRATAPAGVPTEGVTLTWHVPATKWSSPPVPVELDGAKTEHQFGDAPDVDGIEVEFNKAVLFSMDAH
jgi:hypothetical protein